MEPLDTIDVETDAGTYRINVFYDDNSDGNPLTEFDQTGFGFAIFESGRYETLNTLSGHAGNAVRTWLDHGYDDEDIERRFALWRAITGDQTVLVTYQADTDRSTSYRCLILVDYLPDYPDWDRKASALATIKEFESWASGEVYGYVVESPDGNEIGACWGFIGSYSVYAQDGYMLEQARENIDYDAEQRLAAAKAETNRKFTEANLVGAGFVGII